MTSYFTQALLIRSEWKTPWSSSVGQPLSWNESIVNWLPTHTHNPFFSLLSLSCLSLSFNTMLLYLSRVCFRCCFGWLVVGFLLFSLTCCWFSVVFIALAHYNGVPLSKQFLLIFPVRHRAANAALQIDWSKEPMKGRYILPLGQWVEGAEVHTQCKRDSRTKIDFHQSRTLLTPLLAKV